MGTRAENGPAVSAPTPASRGRRWWSARSAASAAATAFHSWTAGSAKRRSTCSAAHACTRTSSAPAYTAATYIRMMCPECVDVARKGINIDGADYGYYNYGGDYGEKGGKFSESEAKFRDISSVLPKGDVARVIGPLAPVHLSAFISI